MRIEGLQLKNIGVFKDVEMEFPKCPEGQAEIHIFTGVNGSGKSTILKALACGFEEDTIAPPQRTSTGNSYMTELMKTFEVYEEYGIPVSEKLQEFHQMKKHILEGKNGNTKAFLDLAKDIANVSQSLNNDIQIQLRKLSKQTQKEFSTHQSPLSLNRSS